MLLNLGFEYTINVTPAGLRFNFYKSFSIIITSLRDCKPERLILLLQIGKHKSQNPNLSAAVEGVALKSNGVRLYGSSTVKG